MRSFSVHHFLFILMDFFLHFENDFWQEENGKISKLIIFLFLIQLICWPCFFSSSSSSVLLARVLNRFEKKKTIHFLKHTRTTSTLILSTVVINTANLALANVFASLRSCSLRHSLSSNEGAMMCYGLPSNWRFDSF